MCTVEMGRDTVYHAAIETSQWDPGLLKYKVPKHMTLSHIVNNITDQFLPALHHKYEFKNFKQFDFYRSYKPSVVPNYLQGRLKETILHCVHGQASSNKFVKKDVTQVVVHREIRNKRQESIVHGQFWR